MCCVISRRVRSSCVMRENLSSNEMLQPENKGNTLIRYQRRGQPTRRFVGYIHLTVMSVVEDAKPHSEEIACHADTGDRDMSIPATRDAL